MAAGRNGGTEGAELQETLVTSRNGGMEEAELQDRLIIKSPGGRQAGRDGGG